MVGRHTILYRCLKERDHDPVQHVSALGLVIPVKIPAFRLHVMMKPSMTRNPQVYTCAKLLAWQKLLEGQKKTPPFPPLSPVFEIFVV